MGMRAIWLSAKKKVKQDGWEKELKFKDDFGSTLDDFENLLEKTKNELFEVSKLVDKAAKVSKSLASISNGYQQKLADALKGNKMSALDIELLVGGFNDIGDEIKFLHRTLADIATGISDDLADMKKVIDGNW